MLRYTLLFTPREQRLICHAAALCGHSDATIWAHMQIMRIAKDIVQEDVGLAGQRSNAIRKTVT